MKNIGLKLILLLSGLMIAITISELLLRVFWNPEYLNNKYKRDDLEWMKNYVVLNNYGYRDENIDILRKEETLRIYSLGDSYTFGWYINNGKKAYPSLLESKFDKTLGEGKVEVINAAQPGFTIEEEYDRYINEGLVLAPDIVTVGINIYDLAGREFPPNTKRNLFSTLRIYELLVNNTIRRKSTLNTENEIKDATKENSQQLIKLKDTLKKFKVTTDQNGSKLVLIIFPNYSPSQPNSEYKNKDFHTQLSKIGSELGIDLIDLFDPFSVVEDKAQLILNPTDPHPSELANEITAEYLTEKIKINPEKKNNQEFRQHPLLMNAELNNLKAIVDINPRENWVYFNRQFKLGTEKSFFKDTKDRKTSYMSDYLKTAKAFTHQGWPGAQIEYNYPSEDKKILISRFLYGLPVVGIHQVTGYYRQGGNLNSEYILFKDLKINRDESNVYIEIYSLINFDFYRIIVDVGIKQFDIEGKKIVSLTKTNIAEKALIEKTKKLTLNLNNAKILNISLPTYSSYENTTNYLWLNDQIVEAQIEHVDGRLEIKSSNYFDRGKIEVPFSDILEYAPEEAPTILYI